jgi:hypothetical protein
MKNPFPEPVKAEFTNDIRLIYVPFHWTNHRSVALMQAIC